MLNEKYYEALITDRHCPSAVYCATPLFHTLFVLPMRKS
jgi:hypothetical protein